MFILLLKQVGCEQFYDEINKKLFSLVIPSYIQVNETENASGSVDNQGKTNVQTLLFEHLPKATLQGKVDEGCVL